FPVPTGPSAVGRTFMDWTEARALDPLVPGAKRELLVWIWYPAAGTPGALGDFYVPQSLRARLPTGAPSFSLIQEVAGRFLRLLTRHTDSVRSYTTADADVSRQAQASPVVLMRAGASAGVLNYSTLAEDLASHGYVVVGFDAPYRTGGVVFPDGRVIERRP